MRLPNSIRAGREVIRLAGVDAPEHDQAFGAQSTANPAALLSGNAVIEVKLCFDKGDHGVELSASYQGPVRGSQRSHAYQWPGWPYYENIGESNRVEFPSAQSCGGGGIPAGEKPSLG